jgi:hypothetical protein
LGVRLTAPASAALEQGFDGDHAFDAFVGMLGLVAAVRGRWPGADDLGDLDPPVDAPATRTVEGWILGATSPAVTGCA